MPHSRAGAPPAISASAEARRNSRSASPICTQRRLQARQTMERRGQIMGRGRFPSSRSRDSSEKYPQRDAQQKGDPDYERFRLVGMQSRRLGPPELGLAPRLWKWGGGVISLILIPLGTWSGGWHCFRPAAVARIRRRPLPEQIKIMESIDRFNQLMN